MPISEIDNRRKKYLMNYLKIVILHEQKKKRASSKLNESILKLEYQNLVDEF